VFSLIGFAGASRRKLEGNPAAKVITHCRPSGFKAMEWYKFPWEAFNDGKIFRPLAANG